MARKWKIKDNVVFDDKDVIICILPNESHKLNNALIKHAPEMFDAIINFCGSMESTKIPRNPKLHYDNFQRILIKISDSADS